MYYLTGGYSQITSLSNAVAIGAIPNGAKKVLIQAEAQNVRYRDDGTDPTATVGMLLAAGSTLEYTGPMSSLKFIEAASGAKLNIIFQK